MNTLRPHQLSVEIPEAEIQHEAHRLWLEKGRPEGRDLETWLEAKELLRHRPRHETGSTDSQPDAVHFPAAAAASPAGRRSRHQARN